MEKPKIRFKGYQEDWEQRKLGELGSLKNGMNFSKEAMGVGYPFVNLQNIFGNNVIDVSDLGKAMASDSQLKDYNLINGDVLFVRSSVKLEGVGEAALVPQTLENTTYSGFIIRFRDEYGLDNNFKRFVFGIDSVRNQIMSQATNSANKNISQSVLENLELAIPSKSEQQKIGAYFSNLDYLITLHQRKCEEMKTLKKYMLQKMFPQNGQSVPQIRFSGFTEDWEQRKLSDVVDSVDTGKSRFDKEGSSGEYPILGSTSVIGYDDEYDYEGDFILTARVGANAGSLYRHAGKVKISDNTVFIQASQNIEFLYQLLIQFDIKKLSFGTGQPLVKASELKSLELMMPSDMKEQMRIGVYFKNLDSLITLHQQKCDELRNIKKFMLQNMFI